MEKWTIKLKTLKAGPTGVFKQGEIYEEDADIARALINSGQAILIKKSEIEERINSPEETAILPEKKIKKHGKSNYKG
jgi:hypothetical protein